MPPVRLLFPPQWVPLNPHFSLPALCGTLRRGGVEVDPVDLNVAFYRQILTPRYLDYTLARARNAREYLQSRLTLGTLAKEDSRAYALLAARYLEIERWLGPEVPVWETVRRDLPEAVAVFTDPVAFYDPVRLVRAFMTVDKALELVSVPFHPNRLRLNDFSAPGHPLTVEGLVAFTESTDDNLFLPFLQAQVPRLLRDDPPVVGISINSHSQLFGGLTLARLLKARRSERTHVTLGGNYFLRVKDALLAKPRFLETFADSVLLGEAEGSLLALCRGADPRGVPNLIGPTGFTFPEAAPPLADRALPDLEGLPLDSYFTPEIVLSTRTSKGCSWQKCTFCDTDFGLEPDVRPVEAVVDEIRLVGGRWGIRNFEFIDECLDPGYMEVLAPRLEGLGVHFFGNGRTEKGFTPDRLRAMSRAGLTMILWGIESGSERILRLIRKGVDPHRRLDILRDAREAGLWNFGFLFFGFPTETEEEARETIDLLRDHTELLNSYGRSVFTLGKHSKLRTQAEKLGIVDMVEDPQEFSTTLDYRVTRGMTREEALRMADRCRLECAVAYDDPLWMHLRHREVLHLYLKEKGRDFVEGFRFTPDQRANLESLYAPTPEALLAVGLLSAADSP